MCRVATFSIRPSVVGRLTLNPLSTMPRFHIHCGYYLVILYSIRNLLGGIEIVKTLAVNFLTPIHLIFILVTIW
ncbi:hypothetical protein E2C01_042489 [Portunus trituberculatus]|uniref:Uncharacterized protein n=1 Tax=Portunus trituberculatus TaxID=210409 RepID=A0A5B7FTL1_PORTR|nr:hypothetical protein [Portunus trituberculatus]